MPRIVLFDLDGTLVNALPDIADLVNKVLSGLGYPVHEPEEYRQFIGWGSTELIRKALPAEARQEALVASTERSFRELYEARPVSRSTVYPGMPEALRALSGRGALLAVLSNKPHEVTGLVLTRLFPEIEFARAYGTREGVPRKPDPAAALEIARELGSDPGSCLFVGDSGVDMRTARNAGMTPIGVAWGYRDRAELTAEGAFRIAERPVDLVSFFG